LLFGYLESSVIEAVAPNGGVFHPKVTVLRYTANPPAAAFYRVLCASRNLTFDRSWDTLLTLEGKLDRKAFGRNRRLSRFVAALGKLATRPLSEDTRADIEKIASELLRVRFEEPEGFEDLAFWPIGLDERKVWPFDTRTDRVLVVSPFVDPTFLNWIVDQVDGLHLVSRLEALDELPNASLRHCESCHTLNDSAERLETQTEPDDETPPEPRAEDTACDDGSVELEPSEIPLRGLHAKLFVADAGWEAKVWTGSANATAAAFERNVEFLVELTGRASRHGVRALLREHEEHGDRDRRIRFRDLLVPY